MSYCLLSVVLHHSSTFSHTDIWIPPPQGSLTALLRYGPFTAKTSTFSMTNKNNWTVVNRRLKEYIVQQWKEQKESGDQIQILALPLTCCVVLVRNRFFRLPIIISHVCVYVHVYACTYAWPGPKLLMGRGVL